MGASSGIPLTPAATIVAIATAIVPQQGSIGVVRLSGSEAQAIAQQLFHAPGQQLWESHRILYGHIRDPNTQELVDEGLLLLMLAPRSYTREDVVEFHCHGGMIAVQRILALCLQAGARLAQPGEFTLRAFLNGRLDLTQAESVADLVGARSPQAAQVALVGLQGKLASPIRALRQQCLHLLAEIEARIDFDEDLPPLNEAELKQALQAVVQQVTALLATADQGELLRSGIRVAIIGRPNVGKSSLLNAWSRSDRAIVTDLPGTTRDVVESHLVVGGIPVVVLDTAGIRDTDDRVEQLGVERSLAIAAQADLVLLTVDASEGWTPEDNHLWQGLTQPTILVINKVDLAPADRVAYPAEIPAVVTAVAAQQEGIPALEAAILHTIQSAQVRMGDTAIAINQRQAEALTRAQQSLEQMQQAIAAADPLDFWTIDLRDVIHALGEITGEDLVESVLDRIFSQFCIGK
jgi:tRNA modification GTPase